MSGIAGVLHFNGTAVQPELLRRMTETMKHRGPDDDGFYYFRNMAFGCRRLTIHDADTGRQPVHNEDGTIWVVFSGSVYDYSDLRAWLQGKGHQFYTKCDAELIVHLYEDFRERLVEYLNGSFSFALYDENENTLLLARDRMGKKPLYYSVLGDKLLFGSEPKALRAHPDCPADIDRESLLKYLQYGCVPAPGTIYAGIRKLRPAECLVYRDGGVRQFLYWDLPYNEPKLEMDVNQAEEELNALLAKSVQRRMSADVPVGVFLSGGVDSSLTAALMVEHSSLKVKTFTVAFEEKGYDESMGARRVARHLGSEHSEAIFSSQMVFDSIPYMARLIDEPLADPTLLPTYILSRFTKNSVTVALGGDGSDEILGGYRTYLAHKFHDYYLRLSSPVQKTTEAIAARLPVTARNGGLDRRLQAFLRGLGYPLEQRHVRWKSLFLPEELPLLLRPELLENVSREHLSDELQHYSRKEVEDAMEKAMYIDAKLYLQNAILTKVDRAGMAASLEVRSPFLDKELVEFVVRLPAEYKVKGWRTKYLLRRIARRHLPAQFVRQKRHGMGLPLSKWFHGELAPLVKEYLDPERLEKGGIFRKEYVQRLLSEHASRQRDHGRLLWTVLWFELWREHHGKN